MESIKIHNTLVETEDVKNNATRNIVPLAYDLNVIVTKQNETINTLFVLSNTGRYKNECTANTIKCSVRVGARIKDKLMKIIADDLALIRELELMIQLVKEERVKMQHVDNISEHMRQLLLDKLIVEFDREDS